VYKIALRKLKNEGLMQNITFLWADNEIQDVIFGYMLIG